MFKHRPNVTAELRQDSYLAPYLDQLAERRLRTEAMERNIVGEGRSLADFASGHEFFGLHFRDGGWIFREWAPNATEIFLVGDFSNWKELPKFSLRKSDGALDIWETALPADAIHHGMLYRLKIHWRGGSGDRLPTYVRRVVQDQQTKIFNAQVWQPQPYRWKNIPPDFSGKAPLIYETHIGMSREFAGVSSYRQFQEEVLPRIIRSGYNTIQIMAVMEHPYYGSFGYHVSNFFAASSRFGTPEEFKELVDVAHGFGLRVIIDLIHSHAVRNEIEGLGCFDGTKYQYFHAGARGSHSAWDSYCFDYSKPQVLHFLLSNCRFWLDEYQVDGFRFDGITSMLYKHHGLGHAFTSYHDYFSSQVDEESLTYLTLANKVIHQIRPDAITIAEDVSGMPGLAAPVEQCGCGFDYRLAMGVTDCWFKQFDIPDESWSMSGLWHELTNRRLDEKTISYVECHDQAIVGGQTVIFRLIGKEMYDAMHNNSSNLLVDRGMAIHKMARLATLATAGNGYLNFIGNEFGHPEWIDFPREGNNWSYHYARRQWSLADNPGLRFHFLQSFDREMVKIAKKYNLINSGIQKLYINDEKKIMAFERAGLFFFFNFSPSESYTDYPVEALPGEYVLELDTDSPDFGGHGRLSPGQHYFTLPEQQGNEIRNMLKLYLPSRSAIVLRKTR
ncbi:MAG: alpha amylase C-terminal domain-containing protein [Lentisphaerota bacterium]